MAATPGFMQKWLLCWKASFYYGFALLLAVGGLPDSAWALVSPYFSQQPIRHVIWRVAQQLEIKTWGILIKLSIHTGISISWTESQGYGNNRGGRGLDTFGSTYLNRKLALITNMELREKKKELSETKLKFQLLPVTPERDKLKRLSV